MSFNPNQLLNTPLAMMNPLLAKPKAEQAAPAVPPPPFNEEFYVNAFTRLGMLSIDNVVDLGCGQGNFTSIMASRGQRPDMYLGIDNNHSQISIAKAAYPGWKFIYGDFTHERVRAEYERYGAFLMLNVIDHVEDDIALLQSMPYDKPLVFSIARQPLEGTLRHFAEGRDIHDRYSSFLSINTIGRFTTKESTQYSMVVATRW